MKRSLLVVDDEPQICDSFGTYFEKQGYDVSTAMDGPAALAALERKNVPVCLLDLALPGMNGLELCQEIKQSTPMATCIAMTGKRSLFEIFECRAAGFEDYFTKPVSLEVIRQAVDQAYERMERWKQT